MLDITPAMVMITLTTTMAMDIIRMDITDIMDSATIVSLGNVMSLASMVLVANTAEANIMKGAGIAAEVKHGAYADISRF